jgi:methyl-accepting chemotaxis protein
MKIGTIDVVPVSLVTSIMSEIAVASDEQSKGIDQVGQAVMQMDEVMQQNAALVEQAAAAAQSLQDQAVKLNAAVAVFSVV